MTGSGRDLEALIVYSQLEQAKALCVDCPIRPQCLAAALDRVGERWDALEEALSGYREDSEISRLNRGELTLAAAGQVKTVAAGPVRTAHNAGLQAKALRAKAPMRTFARQSNHEE